MSKPSQKTLVTLTSFRSVDEAITLNPEVTDAKFVPRTNLNSLIERANQQYTEIRNGDRATALRGIFLGLLFWQIKNEAGHGNFMAIATKEMPAISQASRNHYMRLAAVFVEKSRVALPERMTIPDAQYALRLDDGSGAESELVKKAVAFIGDLSLHELMIKHEIRAVGLKKELSDEADQENNTPLPPDEELRRRREQIFGECADHVVRLHKTLTNTEDLTLLESAQLDSIDSQLIEIRAAIASARKPAA